jgi:hypothetical protein
MVQKRPLVRSSHTLETEGSANGRKHGRLAVRSFFSALILLVAACILGSLFAALRAVICESESEREEWSVFAFGAEVTVLDDRMIEIGLIVIANPEIHYGL